VKLIHHAESIDVKHGRHISLLKQEVERAGIESRIVGVPYWTDAAILVHRAKIPTCIFGPGNIENAHTPDEYVKIHEVVDAIPVFVKTAQRYCGAA